jgi:hypothetical protein
VRRDGRIAHLPNCGAGELCGSFGRAVGAPKKRFQIIAKDLRLERHAVLQDCDTLAADRDDLDFAPV